MARLFIQVDAVGSERVGRAGLLFIGAGRRRCAVFAGAAHSAGFGSARLLGDTVSDVVDGVVTRHFLLLQEEGGVRFAFREDGDQDVGAGHFVAARGLDVDDGALDDALEAGRGLGFFGRGFDQGFQIGLDIGVQGRAQLGEIDIAGAHDGGGIDVVDQRQEKVLKGRVFMMMRVGVPHCAMQGFL